MKKLYWKGVCRGNRITAISQVGDIVSRHAAILNFQKFSDLEMSMLVEADPAQLGELYTALQGVLNIEGDPPENGDSGSLSLVFLHLSFPGGRGDLEIEVPNVPG